jgi:hypothetical protein
MWRGIKEGKVLTDEEVRVYCGYLKIFQHI